MDSRRRRRYLCGALRWQRAGPQGGHAATEPAAEHGGEWDRVADGPSDHSVAAGPTEGPGPRPRAGHNPQSTRGRDAARTGGSAGCGAVVERVLALACRTPNVGARSRSPQLLPPGPGPAEEVSAWHGVPARPLSAATWPAGQPQGSLSAVLTRRLRTGGAGGPPAPRPHLERRGLACCLRRGFQQQKSGAPVHEGELGPGRLAGCFAGGCASGSDTGQGHLGCGAEMPPAPRTAWSGRDSEPGGLVRRSPWDGPWACGIQDAARGSGWPLRVRRPRGKEVGGLLGKRRPQRSVEAVERGLRGPVRTAAGGSDGAKGKGAS